MFFADPVAAFREYPARAEARRAGWSSSCWRTPQENPWGAVPMRAAQPFLPPLPRPGPEDPGQFSFGDRARVERILSEAGFHGLSIEPVDRQMLDWAPASPTCWQSAGRFGPLARAFAGRRRPQRSTRPSSAIAEALDSRIDGATGCELPGACWLVSARPDALQRLMEHITTFPLPPVTLVLGGARSGKSTHAEKLVTGSLFGAAPRPAVYIATAAGGRRRDGDPHHGPSHPPRRRLDHHRGAAEARRGAGSRRRRMASRCWSIA